MLKDISMALRLIGILYLFYLQYTNMVSIPLSVVVLISLGSLGAAMSCKLKHTDSYIHARVFNYAIALAGLVIILQEYM